MDGAIIDGGKQASTGIATKPYTNAVIVAVWIPPHYPLPRVVAYWSIIAVVIIVAGVTPTGARAPS